MTKHDSFLFFLQFLSCLTALHSFSLKNCTMDDSEKVVVLCQNYGLKEIPDDIPNNSEVLDMSFNKISELKATNLRNVSKLVFLLLNNNQLNHIDDKAFADLKALTMLKLSYNSLSNLTDQIFVGLDNLVFLHLEHNRISQISPKAFQPLVSLHQVMLDWNHIDHIRDIAMLFQSPNIESISVSKNNFTNFDSDDLPFNTTNVKLLKLDYNPLHNFSLKRDIFPHLRSISLFRSTIAIKWDIVNKTFLRSITEISLGGDFVGLDTYIAILHSTRTLQRLHLSVVNSKIIHNTTEVACSIPSLTTLELSLNLLRTIDDNLLRPCSQLTGLVLFLNNLQEMSDQSLKSLTQLKFLNLNSNELTKVPVTIRGLSALESLDLSVNYIVELDCSDFITLINLKTLDLRGNHIARLQECNFQTLHNLNSLDVSHNLVHSLENAFKVNMSKLDNLDLSENGDHLQIKQGEFVNLSSLQVLKLRCKTYYFSDEGAFQRLNNLKSLTFSINWYSKELFQGLTQLESLELHLTYTLNLKDSKNDTDEPPFSGLPTLKILSLKVYDKFIVVSPDLLSGLISLLSFSADHFFHTSIHPDTFKYTPNLLKLKIINSYLSTLPYELFEPIPQLQHLDLSNNTLQSLDFLISLKVLRWLMVPKNQLSIMNETMFQTLPALRFLDVTSNPLACECSNAGFQQWVLTNNQTQVINGHKYKCAFPVTQQENMFLDFDTHYCWIDFGFICFISSFCLILFTIFVAFVYSFLRWQLAYAYYLFLAYVSDTKYKKKGTGHLYDAFISYNVHNEDWVYSEMLPMLERKQGWKLCLHHRDFEPGKPIVENITDAIYGSRKTICVISQDYLQSEWCSREIQIASARLFEEQKDVLILVFLEDIPTWRLSPYYQIRRLVKKHTYLSWPQAAKHKGVFWQKLNQALETVNSARKHLITEQEDA